MKVKMSEFLTDIKPALKELVQILSSDYSYVSILGTDSKGKVYSVQRKGVSINDSSWGERGFVVRIHNGINYSEFSFNDIDKVNIEQTAAKIKEEFELQIKDIKASLNELNSYPVLEEKEIIDSMTEEIKLHPEMTSPEDKIKKLASIMNRGLEHSNLVVDCRVNYQVVQFSKLFISNKKELEQSYMWSEGHITVIARRDNNTRVGYKSFSGLKGDELLDEMNTNIGEAVEIALSLLDAKPPVPGEYEVICTPGISGLIAHEAFGHGVEMDMFVKKRAKAVEYINKQIASELVTMHDGAASARDISSYMFDDEGTLGTDTVIIEKGILKAGISDILSAMALGTVPTGNGKRESFERKAYTRMTNTFFSGGNDRLEDMIGSIKHGYMLDGLMSGMEDPKNWGIQCMILQGKEIVDGKFTGKVVSPVIMTGYVPDLLKSISMVSGDVELEGAGACGKGHKEFSKVSSGGPYIKAKVRLG